MSLVGMQAAGVEAARVTMTNREGCGVVRVELTPVGLTPRLVSAIPHIDEQPNGGVQERAATFTMWLSEVPDLLTDGATILHQGETWTVRESTLGAALQTARAWA